MGCDQASRNGPPKGGAGRGRLPVGGPSAYVRRISRWSKMALITKKMPPMIASE